MSSTALRGLRWASVAFNSNAFPHWCFLIWFFVGHVGASYDKVKECLSHPIVAVLMVALIWSAAIHMRIGLKEIIEDYLHNKLCKVSSLILVTFFAAIVGIASTLAIVKIALGS